MRFSKLSLAFVSKLTIVTSVLLLVWYFTTPDSSIQAVPQQAYTQTTKKILLWNKFFNAKHFSLDLSRQLFEAHNCEVTDCQIWDANDGLPDDIPVEDFDLLWFHGHPMNSLWPNRPSRRKPNQVYMFYSLESAEYENPDYRPLRGFFNWTATYRTDSDIVTPYGWFINQTLQPFLHSKLDLSPTFMQPRFDNITTQVTGKTKPIYWMVSNCVMIRSNRDVYVEELSRHIPVDIYGRCGTPCTGNLCDRDVLVSTYKFYLAFENSLCKDYITEKFYNAMHSDIVPVVRGGGDYARHAPPYSYIDAGDFKSPKDLAEYLLFLDKNDAEYRKYFWWKDYYMAHGDNVLLCAMCAMLHDPPPPKSIDLEQWWKNEGKCVKKPVGVLRQVKRLYIHFRYSYVFYLVVVFMCFVSIVFALLKNRCILLARRVVNYRHVGTG